MDHNAFLVFWLLGIPAVLAIVDRMMMAGGRTTGAGAADGYISRQGTRPSSTTPSARPL